MRSLDERFTESDRVYMRGRLDLRFAVYLRGDRTFEIAWKLSPEGGQSAFKYHATDAELQGDREKLLNHILEQIWNLHVFDEEDPS